MAFREHEKTERGWIDVDDVDSTKRRARLRNAPVHCHDPSDGKWKESVDRVEDGEDEVRLPGSRVRAVRARGRIGWYGPQGTLRMTKVVRVQERVTGTWGDLSLTLDDNVTKESGKRVWIYRGGGHLLRLILDPNQGAPKWTYRFVPGSSGRFRFRIVVEPEFTPTSSGVNSRKPALGGENVGAYWFAPTGRRYSYSWLDMLSDVAFDDFTDDVLTLRSAPKNLAASEAYVLDPTLNQDAAWAADFSSSSIWDSDGEDWIRHSGSIRIAWRFAVDSIDGETVTSVKLKVQVSSVSGATVVVAIGPYKGDGTGEPDADTASDRWFVYSDIIGDSWEYLTGLTDYQTTGEKTTADMGSTAHADVEATASGAGFFTLVMQSESATSSDYSVIEPWDAGTASEKPELIVEYTTGGGGGIEVLRRRIEGC